MEESLKESISARNIQRSAYYCGELLLIYLKVGDLVQAYKYACDLLRYSDMQELKEFCDQLKYRIEENVPDVPEELVKKAELIVHRTRVGT